MLVEELTYNGLGHLIGEHADTDTDGDVDGSDKWYYTAYDEQWRGLATYRESDSDPKEIFVLQQAGADGFGGSSYINGMILRYKDANTAWTSASDGTLEQVYFYAENWRGDVVALTDHLGKLVEWAKYSAYGVPFGLPKGDADSDGDCDSTDANTVIQGWIGTSSFDTRGDLDLDGDVDSSDKSLALSSALTLGHGVLSGSGSRRGVAGYGLDSAATYSVHHVRYRCFSPRRGAWITRDPLGYQDGTNVLEYSRSNPIRYVDPTGLTCICNGVCQATVSGYDPCVAIIVQMSTSIGICSKPDCVPSNCKFRVRITFYVRPIAGCTTRVFRSPSAPPVVVSPGGSGGFFKASDAGCGGSSPPFVAGGRGTGVSVTCTCIDCPRETQE